MPKTSNDITAGTGGKSEQRRAFTAQERQQIGRELKTILKPQALLSKDTPALIASAHQALIDVTRRPKEVLVVTLSQLRKAIDLEAHAHQALVAKINRATEMVGQIIETSLARHDNNVAET